MKISQSFMKSFAEYKVKEECGLVVKAKYLDGIQSVPTKAMKLGQYFEYMATGGLPHRFLSPLQRQGRGD